MKLEEAKACVEAVEDQLDATSFVVACTFEREGRVIRVALTEHLHRSCRRGRVWKSKSFLTALKNAAYGFDLSRPASPGGRDGIYMLDRDHRPPNEMMHKLFDRFLDRPDSGATELAAAIGCDLQALLPVRLVSHHMRLLGLLLRGDEQDLLVLVDYDDTK
jgi:hypothetical protein